MAADIGEALALALRWRQALFSLVGGQCGSEGGVRHPTAEAWSIRVCVGDAYAGWRVAMLIDGLNIEIVGLDGSPLRRLILDPTKDYQRIP
jgi:hypothetical protein